MTRKVGLPLVAGLAVFVASGTLIAAAQSEQRATEQQQSAMPQDTAVQAIAVSPPNATGATRRPLVAMPMTIAECEGLGGKVVEVSMESCPWTGKQCVTANKDGVIKKSCISMKPS